MVKFQLPMPSDRDGGHQSSTARSTSMSKPSGLSYESEDNVVSPTAPLHSKRTTQFIPLSSPPYGKKTPNKVSVANHGKQHNFPAAMPGEMAWKNWSDGYQEKRNGQLLKSGSLGLYNNPDRINSPATYKVKQDDLRGSIHLDSKLREILYGDDEGWARKFNSCFNSYFPIMNPHTRVIQQWKKIMIICCLVSVFVDPLFLLLPIAQQDNKCITLDWSLATSVAIVRSVIDFIYFVNMLLQFRLAYVAPESRVVGAGDLVDQPKKITLHYLLHDFLLDLCVALPLPQMNERTVLKHEMRLLARKNRLHFLPLPEKLKVLIMLLIVIPAAEGPKTENNAQDILRLTVFLQYIPRMVKFLQFLTGRSTSGFIFESAWTSFFISILMFLLVGHIFGALWYAFGLQRVNQCLLNACSDSQISSCESFMDCGYGDHIAQFKPLSNWQQWLNDSASNSCFTTSGSYKYGIYNAAVLLTTKQSIILRCIYSLYWGLQQIGTVAGNFIPSYDIWENLFSIILIGSALVFSCWLIGYIQNFLQALGRRNFEMQLRKHDVEQWMNHRRLPEELQRKVRLAESFNWAATRGVDEEALLRNLPDNLQREIRYHFFKFLKKVRIFNLMDEPILDAICERLRQKLYIQGSDILYQGGLVEKMVFIVRGKVESIGLYGNIASLSEGDVCGEELLTWYLEHFSVYKDEGKIMFPRQHLFSTRTVKCLTNVEAFSLSAADLIEVTTMFPRLLWNPRVQRAIRYESPYWRNRAATHIQVVWRYRQWRLKRKGILKYGSSNSSLVPLKSS